MKKLFFGILFLLSVLNVQSQNSRINAESFGVINPVDSLNFITATTRV